MDAEQQAGLAGLLALLHDLLWWGGAIGVAVLVGLSVAGRRATPAEHARGPHSVLAGASRTGDPGPAVSDLVAGIRSSTSTRGSRCADHIVLLAVLTAAACGVHAVMVVAHLQTGPVQPVFFAVVAVVQARQSWRLLVSPSEDVVVAVLGTNVALLAVWLVSRTIGVLGPVEPVGPWDAAVVVWQVACLVVAARLLKRGAPLGPPPLDPTRWGVGVHVVLGLTALTLLLLPGAGHG